MAHITTVGREIAVDDWPANCSTLYGDCSEEDGGRCEGAINIHGWIQGRRRQLIHRCYTATTVVC